MTSQALTQAWAGYHATIEEMRRLTEATTRFQQCAEQRAKAYHTLMEVQAMAYNFVIAPRMEHPRIYRNCGWQTDIYTLGQTSPDIVYGVLSVDGRQTYRLSGRMGDITLVLLQVFNGMLGEPGFRTVGNYDWGDFSIGPDGRFEVMLSPDPQPGNWIKLDASVECQFVMIRRVLVDWHGDAGEWHIERVSPLPDDFYAPDEFDEARMAARIVRATHFMRHVVEAFNIGLYDMYFNAAGKRKNVTTLMPGTETSEATSPSSRDVFAVFELADDEALLIEMNGIPDGRYWSFQLGDVWSRSIDFSHRQSSLNQREIAVDDDGKVRIVIATRDPGIANWLDTGQRHEGTLVFRNFRARTSITPTVRKIRFAEIESQLPPETKRVSSAERRRALESRRLAQLKIHGE
ncbi:MAG: DUF1214 domain-containing protein [Steroidobacteraceae bacterium]